MVQPSPLRRIQIHNGETGHSKSATSSPSPPSVPSSSSALTPMVPAASSSLFDYFLFSSYYSNRESTLTYNLDLIRKSNTQNEDPFDFVLLVKFNVEEEKFFASAVIHNGGGGGKGGQLAQPSLEKLVKSLVEHSDGTQSSPPSTVPPLPLKEKLTLSLIVRRMKSAGLLVKVDPHMKICAHNEVMVLIKLMAKEDRLEREASFIRLNMKLKNGGFAIFDENRKGDFIGTGDPLCLFRSSERQMLIEHIIKSRMDEGGAGLDPEVYSQTIVGQFPLHMHSRLYSLSSWMIYWKLRKSNININFIFNIDTYIPIVTGIFNQPLDNIASYYGEEIAFYFAFLGFFTLSLVLPSIFGLILLFTQLNTDSIDSPLIPFFSIFLSLWATILIEYWKRYNLRLSYDWGVLGYEENIEAVRPEFIGEWQPNKWTGRLEKVTSPRNVWLKLAMSIPINLLILCVWCGGILTAFIYDDQYSSTLDDTGTGVINVELFFVPVIFGLIIPISDLIFNRIAKKLNNWENWRTHSVYNKSLILKIFSFRFINSFTALYYYAFADLGILRLTTSVASFLIMGQLFRFCLNVAWPALWLRIMFLHHRVKRKFVSFQRKKSIVTDEHGVPIHSSTKENKSTKEKESPHGPNGPPLYVDFGFHEGKFESLPQLDDDDFEDDKGKLNENSIGNEQIEPMGEASKVVADIKGGGIVGAETAENGKEVIIPTSSPTASPQSSPSSSPSPSPRTSTSSSTSSPSSPSPFHLSVAWHEAELPSYDLFESYANLTIQYCYICFFSVAFPLAPLCALINNLIEIRSSAAKLIKLARRPCARRASGIGVWLDLLQVLSIVAVLTNAGLIGFTSSQIDNWAPNLSSAAKILVIFVFEHIVILLKLLLQTFIPHFSDEIKDKIAAENEVKTMKDREAHKVYNEKKTNDGRIRQIQWERRRDQWEVKEENENANPLGY